MDFSLFSTLSKNGFQPIFNSFLKWIFIYSQLFLKMESTEISHSSAIEVSYYDNASEFWCFSPLPHCGMKQVVPPITAGLEFVTLKRGTSALSRLTRLVLVREDRFFSCQIASYRHSITIYHSCYDSNGQSLNNREARIASKLWFWRELLSPC